MLPFTTNITSITIAITTTTTTTTTTVSTCSTTTISITCTCICTTIIGGATQEMRVRGLVLGLRWVLDADSLQELERRYDSWR